MGTISKKLIIIFYGILLLSCREKVHDKLCNDLLKNKNEIKLKELTNFEWDTLYIIRGLMIQKQIERIIKTSTKIESIGEEQIAFVFLKDNKEAYTEIEDFHSNCLIESHDVSYGNCDTLQVKKVSYNSGAIYLLRHEKW